MKQKRPDSEFVENIRHVLDRSAEALAPSVTESLSRVRQRALQQQRQSKKVWLKPQRWLPAAAIAAAVVVFVVLLDDHQDLWRDSLCLSA